MDSGSGPASTKDRAIAAVRVSLRHAGLAVAVTSIVIIGGLVLNLGSSFPPLRLLGLLGSVVIGLALLANVTLLPALIVVSSGRGLATKTTPS